MVWAVKYTYEHWNEDVLLLLHLGLPEDTIKMVEDPRIIHKIYIRSDDRTYAEVYLLWKNKQSYDEWRTEYPEWNEKASEVQKYVESFGIVRCYYEPPCEDFSWMEHPSHRPDKVEWPRSAIQHMDIFVPPEE